MRSEQEVKEVMVVLERYIAFSKQGLSESEAVSDEAYRQMLIVKEWLKWVLGEDVLFVNTIVEFDKTLIFLEKAEMFLDDLCPPVKS